MPTNPTNSPKKNQPDYSYMRYASMATQMLVIIGLGVWGGVKLDAYFGLKVPICTLSLSLLSVAAAIYLSIKDFIKKKWILTFTFQFRDVRSRIDSTV